jgi:hypothetical protein
MRRAPPTTLDFPSKGRVASLRHASAYRPMIPMAALQLSGSVAGCHLLWAGVGKGDVRGLTGIILFEEDLLIVSRLGHSALPLCLNRFGGTHHSIENWLFTK